MSHDDVERLVERYRAGWFGHDVDAIMATVSADIVFHNVTAGERVEGAEAFRAHVAGIHERWPDLRFEEHADLSRCRYGRCGVDRAGDRPGWTAPGVGRDRRDQLPERPDHAQCRVLVGLRAPRARYGLYELNQAVEV